MNDDLISRRELLEELKDFRMSITGSTNAMALTIMEETKKSIMRIVDEQPSAYDVDKVIKSINKIGQKYCDSVECENNCEDCEHSCLMGAITNVIKSGGVTNG